LVGGATFFFSSSLIIRTKQQEMKRSITTFLFAFAIISNLFAQNTDTRDIDSFSAIGVGEAIKLILVPGNKNEAKIVAHNVDLDEIETRVSGSKLKIELSGNHYRNIEVEITLTYKNIEELSVSSAANVTTKGAIKADDLEISVSSAGYAKLEVEAVNLDVSVSSSGDLVVEGKATSQRVGVSSAGEYKGYDLSCDDTYVKASSAGSARVTANKKIDANASSAGSVKYKGSPDKVYVNASSGGSAGKAN
jgi:hypothetical protein